MNLLELDYNPKTDTNSLNDSSKDNIQINFKKDNTNLIKNPINFDYFQKDTENAEDYYKNTNLKVFIMTEIGKPIYSNNFKEEDISSIMATLNLILNKSKISYSKNKELNPNYFVTDTMKCVFLIERNIYYIIIDSFYEFEIHTLKLMIKYLQNFLYLHIHEFYILKLQENPSFDILNKSNLYKKEIDYCVKSFIYSINNIFNTINIFPLNENHRKNLNDILKNKNNFKLKNIYDEILVSMILTNSNLITYNSFDDYILTPIEINLLSNLSNFYIKKENKLYYKKIIIPSISNENFLSFSTYCFNNHFQIIIISMFNEENKKDIEYYVENLVEQINKNNIKLILSDYFGALPISFYSIKIENLNKAIIIEKSKNMMCLIGFGNYRYKIEKIKILISLYNDFKILDEEDKNYSIIKTVNSKNFGIFNKEKILILAISKNWINEFLFENNVESLYKWVKNEYENLFFIINK